MRTMTPIEDLTFTPPGPGAWLRDSVHVPRPFSRFHSEIYPAAMAKGFRETSARYGLLIDHLAWQLLHGFAYFCPQPVDAGELAARFEAAERALDGKLWREDMELWQREAKPASIRAHLSLQAVAPEELTDEELLGHLARCREHLRRMIVQHHRFNGAAFVPVGDFLAHVGDWTSVPAPQVLRLLRGVAPASAGASAELDRAAEAIRDSPAARTLVCSAAQPAQVLDGLRSLPGAPGAAITGWLAAHGYRLLSPDVGDPYALEVPVVLVNALRRAVEEAHPREWGPSELELARVRDLVPPRHSAGFDELLGEARRVYALRDERALYSDVWAGGITRRAILAAGARLADDERIEHASDLAEAGHDEIRRLIRGSDRPSGDELSDRQRFRATYRASDAPPFLGEVPGPPPPLDGVPPAAARATRAMRAAIVALFSESDARSGPSTVRGSGISPGAYTGTARVLGSPTEFGRLQPGDILVTHSTTEAFNVVLPTLGALVTDAGGLLSHAAIVCREYGLPGIVGSCDATMLIPDGALVTVDGSTGEAVILG